MGTSRTKIICRIEFESKEKEDEVQVQVHSHVNDIGAIHPNQTSRELSASITATTQHYFDRLEDNRSHNNNSLITLTKKHHATHWIETDWRRV